MRGIAMVLVALWGILHRIVLSGFRSFIAVEEEGTRRGTTMCDATERHCSGVEQAADPEDSVSGVEEPAGEGVARTGDKWFQSRVNCGRCTFTCVKSQDTGSGTSLGYDQSPVRSLKELEEAVEECNSNHLLFFIEFFDGLPSEKNVPELKVTEELIKLLMRIKKDLVSRFQDCEVFYYAWYKDIPNLVKLAVGVVKSSVVCPMSPFVNKAAMDSAFMSCDTMPQLLNLLLDFNPNFSPDDSFLSSWTSGLGWKFHGHPWKLMQDWKGEHPWTMMQEYKPNYEEGEWLSNCGVIPEDEFQCYSQMTNSECTLQNLTNQWKLDAHVNGLKSPWSTNFNHILQKIELQVLMEPSVLLNNSLTLKILNLKFHSGNAGRDASLGILSRFFLSRVALTVTPEVDPQHFFSAELGLGSANPAHDMLFGTTSGTSATIPLGKGVPTLGFTSAQTISLTSKNVTDWKHEQTHGTEKCHSSKSGTFSWTLKNLGGIPFDRENPSYPRSFKKSSLELPFNEDGSVTFTYKEYPGPITWSFKPELEGTMVVWRISMEVYVTILNDSRSKSRSKSRSTSAGKTLKFCFARHLEHKLGTD